MEGSYDPAKDRINVAKHGVSLDFGVRVFQDEAHLILPSIRPIDNEERFKVIGLVDGRLFTAVYTWRDDLPRFISVRRSNDGEERAYRTAG
jgi:uncharacterized protein